MESSQTLSIILDMLRSNLADVLRSVDHLPSLDRQQLDNTLKSTVEGMREDMLGKFELVAKADYEAQAALMETMRTQLDEIEKRLGELERKRPDTD
ncbi:MAG: hypothetical protein VX171_06945 [Pseudomonadota bacterium]|nr:hypothetical protein [Pseudomonadota bacterium]